MTRTRQHMVGVAGFIALAIGAWFLLARAGAFAPMGRALGVRIPGDRYSYTFIPPGKFCTGSGRRCFFVNLGDGTLAPALEKDAEGYTFTIRKSVTDRADFKAEHQLFMYEIIVINGDQLNIRAPEGSDSNWLEYRRQR